MASALRGECSKNKVLLHNYPAYSQAEPRRLEQYAVAPYKFAAQVSGRDVRAHRERILRLKTSQDEEDGVILILCVIPGGRYIVTSSSSGLVVIWDLCEPVDGATNPAAVTEISFPTAIVSMDIAFSTKDTAIILVGQFTGDPPQ